MTEKDITPSEDFTRFNKWIEGMEDTEYDYWYENEASAKQKDLADKIRESEIEE